MSCDMQGFTTQNDLSSLYFELIGMSKEERESKAFALFVRSRVFLNGEEALQYLKEKMNQF